MAPEQANRIVCELYDSRYRALVRYAYRSLGNLGNAEDVVQEAFMELYRNLRGGVIVRCPAAWALSVVRRQISREVRRHLKTTALHEPLEVLESVAQGKVPPQPYLVEGGDLLRISGLSRREEEVLLLRMEALKYKEIGEVLGISSGSVGTLITRALRKVRSLGAGDRQEEARGREAL